MPNKKIFLKSFLKNPFRTGSVIESSPYLIRKMIKKIDFKDARCLVEFGAGTGNITKKILEKMPANCRLLCFEIEPVLIEKLKKIRDPRLIVISESAEKVDVYLKKYGFQKADCIVSSLPLASLPRKTSNGILKNSYAFLKSGGQYVQFQYSLATLRRIKYLFGSVAVSFVFLNMPPAFIYICVKN
jgi:phospholipid N-methyltransferase